MTKRTSAHYTVAKFLRSETSKKFKLKPIDALILRVMADYIDMKPTATCFAFQKKLALECRYSQKRLGLRITFLSKLNLIHRKKRYKSYHYALGEALISSQDNLSTEKDNYAQSVHCPPDELPSYHQTKRPLIIDIEINNKRENINTTNSFNLFWDIYPCKINKKEAEKIWLAHNLNKIADVIITDVKTRIAKDARWKDKKFILFPANYLKNERWTDEIMEKDDEKYQGTDKLSRRNASVQSYLQHLREQNKH